MANPDVAVGLDVLFNKRFTFKPHEHPLPALDNLFTQRKAPPDPELMREKHTCNGVRAQLSAKDLEVWKRHTRTMLQTSSVVAEVDRRPVLRPTSIAALQRPQGAWAAHPCCLGAARLVCALSNRALAPGVQAALSGRERRARARATQRAPAAQVRVVSNAAPRRAPALLIIRLIM